MGIRAKGKGPPAMTVGMSMEIMPPAAWRLSVWRISLYIPFCRQVKVEFKLKHKDYKDIWCFVDDVELFHISLLFILVLL